MTKESTDRGDRPVSKAYVTQLQERIQELEGALRDQEAQQQNNKDTHHGLSAGDESQQPQTDAMDIASMTLPSPEQAFRHPSTPSESSLSSSPSDSSISQHSATNKTSPTVHKLLSTRGHLSFDQLAGRLRYFGPTTNCHIHFEVTGQSEENRRQAKEQERRTQRVLSSLPESTHDYLMDLFWQHYNSVIYVIHRQAFEEGRDTGGAGPFYSGFLHICLLATGYRFADKQRPDMVGISLAGRESTLHREAKYMLDYELERPGGIPSIAGLLLLGDLEVGCGRDNVGWLYSGMAYRLCFDIGLHLDRSDSGISQKDIEIGRITLWACVVFDRYWALFLGRPTVLKPDDLEIYELSDQFDRLGTCHPAGEEKGIETQIYEALIELMELAGKITEIVVKISDKSGNPDRLACIQMSALDRELDRFYAQLPPSLQYTAKNVRTAPFSFFLLHQQYYSTIILLHRQFARYDGIIDSGDEDSLRYRDTATHLSALSRATCTNAAGRIAQIYWQHRQRFDSRKIFVTGLQHAGNAATALVAAIASSNDRVANDKNMRYLECLTAALKDMSETYQPAERMASVLDVVFLELQGLHPERQLSSTVPARRGSFADHEQEQFFFPSKRGSSSRARAGAAPLPTISQSMTSTGYEPLKYSHPVMPSPAPTSKIRLEKLTSYGPPSDDFVVVDGDQGNEDGSWTTFNCSDPFAIDVGRVVQATPSPFRSAWAGAETPCFNLGHPDNDDRNFMSFLGDNGGFRNGLNVPGPGKSNQVKASNNSNARLHDAAQAHNGAVGYNNSAASGTLSRGDNPGSEFTSDGHYVQSTAKPENIWTEILA